MTTLRYTVYGDPKTKKNNQKIVYAKNRTMLVQNERYKQFAKDMSIQIKPPAVPIAEPVNVKVVFYRQFNNPPLK